jgi:DNA replication protein DnaC
VSWRCPVNCCDGSGLYEAEANMMADCACRPRLIASRRTARLSSAIPPRFRGAAWDRAPIVDLDPGQVSQVRAFCEHIGDRLEAGDGLWMTGPIGTGKTTLGMLVCREAVLAGHTVAIYSLPDLLNRLRATFDSGDSHVGLLDRLAIVDLLHLDDLGAEKSSPWVLEELYSIINARYEQQRSVIVSSNITDRGQLGEQLGERIVSRLTEMCSRVLLDGPDLRSEIAL